MTPTSMNKVMDALLPDTLPPANWEECWDVEAEWLDASRRAEIEEADREERAGDVDNARDLGWREER